jgi:hypothetical protein
MKSYLDIFVRKLIEVFA